ncbi:ankyrin repeat domain-containing protein [Salinisphaera sp. G21_0]|uniref:ankyrin repeat domain-containing protein n=1 Tax=Salinisphaera sp. G21_0 TaxID=2821094 RepID=UPI001ADB399C|nr:ankyrin repeat domain-containing protein [Salinisphaera sp. G21_0]MBO9482524.1 ankyrin repeat domain-containing protein [Salinisphaera sp. G21_0]
MNPNIRQCLLPRDDIDNPEEAAGSSNAQPSSSLQQPVASADNISKRTVASPGNGRMHPSTSDSELGDLGDQLAVAIRKGDRKAVDNLLSLLKERKIDPNLCDRRGHHPLSWISERHSGLSNVLKTLLNSGVDPNFNTVDPLTNRENKPLLLAARNGKYEISKVLLEHGADPHVHDCRNCTALHLAVRQVRDQSIMLLKCLLNHGADINARNHFGHTPLCIAIFNNELLAVNILLAEGADPNIPDKDGSTALDFAVLRWSASMVDDLLAHDANPDKPGDIHSGRFSNPLCEALSKQYTDDDIVSMLLAYGADPNKTSKNGDTPLHLAIASSNSTCVDMLLAHGANPNIRNRSGQTALAVALDAGLPPRIIDALREPFKPRSLKICARDCIRATLMRPQMTPKKTRAKPLSIVSQRLPLPNTLTKFVSNPLTL